jgi:Dolichyl-phosphate-mannose-protein mannosyltransferase
MRDLNLPGGIGLFILLFAVGFVLINAFTRDRSETRLLIRLFAIAFTIRFVLAMVIYQFGFISVLRDEDGSGWVRGIVLAQDWQRQGVSLFNLPIAMMAAYDGQHLGYYYLLGALFFITGAAGRMPAAALNCWFGALTVVLVYRLARSLFSAWVARRAAWMVCIFPSMLIWSAQTIKEPVVILLELCALYGYVRMRRGFQPKHVLLCGAAVLLLVPFRFYAAYLLLGATLLSFVPALMKGRRVASPMIVIAVLVPVIYFTGQLAQHQAGIEKFDLDQIQKTNAYGASSTSSGVDTGQDVRTASGLTLHTAIGAAHLLLAPFPWQMGGSIRMLLTLPELVYWWWLVFAGLIPGVRAAVKYRFGDVLPMLVLIIGFGLLYSVMFYNVGLIFRQRAQLLPYLLILASVGLEQRELRRLAAQQRRAESAQPWQGPSTQLVRQP